MSDRRVSPADGCAWITGASSGIGRDVALRLAAEGWSVAASARNAEALAQLERDASKLKGSIRSFPADISSRDAIAQTIKSIEETDAPIVLALLNAGIYQAMDATVFDSEVFDRIVDVNLTGTAECLEGLISRMLDRGKGHIAIVSSVTGYGGLPTSAAYGATKAALNNMAETLEIELAAHGLRVQIINPGFVDTPAQDDLEFPKPFMVTSEVAAKRIVSGLKKDRFEITFPKRFTYLLKFINNFLPKDTYLKLIRRQTGWDKRARAKK